MIVSRVGRFLLLLALGSALTACASGGSSSPPSAASHLPPAQEADRGRAVSVQQVGGGGSGNGPLMGGLIGGAVGNIAGRLIGGTIGSSLVGMLLGAVGGAIAGQIVDPAKGPTVEIIVEKPDGQQVVVVQKDDAQIELGDMVQIVRDDRGGLKAIRDPSQPGN